jgi:hypothetical protein
MKRAVFVAIAALAVSIGAAAATAAGDHETTAHTAGACVPKIATIKGALAVTSCGPAAATIEIGKRTYTFKDGTCQHDSAAGNVLSLSLGTLVARDADNAGKPYFLLHFITAGSTKIDTVTLYEGGKHVLSVDPIAVKASHPSAGTFTSTKSLLGSPVRFTGTWNCHGPVTSVA